MTAARSWRDFLRACVCVCVERGKVGQYNVHTATNVAKQVRPSRQPSVCVRVHVSIQREPQLTTKRELTRPPKKPQMMAAQGSTTWQLAVMETKPTRQPLHRLTKSQAFWRRKALSMQARPPAAPERVVQTAARPETMPEVALEIRRVEPGLKPAWHGTRTHIHTQAHAYKDRLLLHVLYSCLMSFVHGRTAGHARNSSHVSFPILSTWVHACAPQGRMCCCRTCMHARQVTDHARTQGRVMQDLPMCVVVSVNAHMTVRACVHEPVSLRHEHVSLHACMRAAHSPYQPNQSSTVPSTTRVAEWPGMSTGLPAESKRPRRGPTSHAPIRPVKPPVMCTTPAHGTQTHTHTHQNKAQKP